MMNYGAEHDGYKWYPYIVGYGKLGVYFFSAIAALEYAKNEWDKWNS